MTCRVDSQPNHWFECALGTVGCPYIHNGLTPHCIGCARGDCEIVMHQLTPVLEMGVQEYQAS